MADRQVLELWPWVFRMLKFALSKGLQKITRIGVYGNNKVPVNEK